MKSVEVYCQEVLERLKVGDKGMKRKNERRVVVKQNGKAKSGSHDED